MTEGSDETKEKVMNVFSGKVAAFTLTAIFGAVAIVGFQSSKDKPYVASEETRVCIDNVLIPETLEQADFLTKHAAAAYEQMDRDQNPRDSLQLAEVVDPYLKQGKTVTVTGLDPQGSTSTLPDGTKRPVACYSLIIK
jgi:hypothetical protein